MFWLWHARRDQGPVALRRLWSWERERYRAHLLRLDAEDRYSRFGITAGDTFIESYCDRLDWTRTTVFGAFREGELCGAAECARLDTFWPADAELAFSVERPLQGQGIGSALFGRTVTYARNRGAGKIYVSCLTSNRRMRQIARKFGMRLGGGGVDVEGRLELQPADYLSYWQEAWEEGAGLMRAGLAG